MNDPQLWDLIKNILVVSGGIVAAWFTARLGRKSQAEANSISEANGLVERYNTLTEGIQKERDTAVATATLLRRQVSLWRRHAAQLRGQLYAAGIAPAEADEELDL